MSQLETTDDGDLKITGNSFTLVGGDDEIRQRLIQRLRFFLGEWFLDNTLGIPYFQIVFVKGIPITLIQDVFKDMILATEGVFSLESFDPLEYNVSTRRLEIAFSVITVNQALLEISEELP